MTDNWLDIPVVVVDFETTGRDPKEAWAVEIGAVRIENRKIVERFDALINPGVSIPGDAFAVHGIGDGIVKDAKTFDDALADIYTICEGAIPAAYNAPYDRTILHRELERIGDRYGDIPAFDPNQVWIDPLVWVRKFDRFVKGKGRHRLSVTAKRYGVALENAHRAVHDAEATALVLLHLSKQIGPHLSVAELLTIQSKLHRQQEAERANWLRKKAYN